MMHTKSLSLSFGLVCGLFTGAAQADDLFIDDVIVFNDLLCVGFACLIDEPEIPGRSGLKLNDQNMAILFDDSSGAGAPNVDWQITINDTAAGVNNYFQIEDISNGTAPFRIAAFAPTNALSLNFNGDLGMGTAFPLQEIHIVDGLTPGVRLARDGSNGFPIRSWDVQNSLQGFQVVDQTAGTIPLAIHSAAPTNAAVITQAGFVGLGTGSPDGKLHVKNPGLQLNYFESSNGGAVQIRMRSDSENRRFLATDNADAVKSQIIFKDNEILFTGATDSGANRWLTIGPSGIVSQGPTCNPGPCDRTFDRDFFTVPPIAERAALMWENKHLPAIGPTEPQVPINLTEKMGGVIHELEVAHIYIEQQDRKITRLLADRDMQAEMIADLSRRLERIEAQ